MVVMSFSEILEAYRLKLIEAITFLTAFIELKEDSDLLRAAAVLIDASEHAYAPLAAYGQAILAVICFEAGMRLREKVRQLRERGLEEEDLEYVYDVRAYLKRIADSIESGEYEKSYELMLNRHKGE
ncbi:MAG: hypothetical protein QW291_04135 [Thermofilaceae archaeon]